MTPHDDQLQAATREAAGVLTATTALRMTEHVEASPRFQRWLRRTMACSRIEVCAHVGPSPQLVLAAFTEPGTASYGCSPCMRTALSGAPDRTCDRCSHIVPVDGELRVLMMQLGAALWSVGLCPPCSTALDVHPVEQTTGGAA